MIRCAGICLTLLLCSSSARADLFLLANGGRVEGKLLNPREAPRRSYTIQPVAGGKLTLQRSAVSQVVSRPDVLRSYESALPALPDTEKAHWEMSEKCRKANLSQERKFHLEQVLRHNPEHADARYALGYRNLAGKWQREEDWREDQGYVLHDGQWKLPQEVAIEKRESAYETELIEWRKRVRLWRSWAMKGRDRAAEGLQNLQGIRDPLAAAALAAQLKQPREPRALKELYILVLSRFNNSGPGIGALTLAGLNERDPQLREKALDALAEIKSPVAVQMFIKMLGDEDNKVVNRAAIGLARMNEPQMSTLPLIDALVTEHKRVIGGGGMQTGFGSDGGGGLSMGGKAKVVKEKVPNESVVRALTSLHPGVNYRYNQDKWRAWYVAKNTPRQVNLRRAE